MQFSMQSTAALAIVFLALPIISSPLPAHNAVANHPIAGTSGAAVVPAGNVDPAGGDAKATDKESAKKVVAVLKEYHVGVDQEFAHCTKQNSVEKCLSRINGPIQGKLTGKKLEEAKLQYHNKLGAELAECTKKTLNIKECMTSSTAKGDDFQQKRDLDTRSGITDFFTGFVQGFTGVLQAAGPVLEQAAKFL